jgi:hypothetical protein
MDLMDEREFVRHMESEENLRFLAEPYDNMYMVLDRGGQLRHAGGLLFPERQARLFAAIMNASCRSSAPKELIEALRHHSEELLVMWLPKGNPAINAVNDVRRRTKGALSDSKEALAQGG